MKYPEFEDAIRLCIRAGKNCRIGKSDFSLAFHQAPMSKESWSLLTMKARCPLDDCTYYFVDKCMPFGVSISCAHFQEISNAIAYILKH